MRLTVKATCPMDLSHFPMDSQLCTLEIESYGYAMADLVYFWNDGVKSVEVSPDVSLAEFHVVGYREGCWRFSLLGIILGCVRIFSLAGPWATM